MSFQDTKFTSLTIIASVRKRRNILKTIKAIEYFLDIVLFFVLALSFVCRWSEALICMAAKFYGDSCDSLEYSAYFVTVVQPMKPRKTFLPKTELVLGVRILPIFVDMYLNLGRLKPLINTQTTTFAIYLYSFLDFSKFKIEVRTAAL